MGIKAALSKPFAKFVVNKINHWSNNPIKHQKQTFLYLIRKAQNTAFGKAHDFSNITDYTTFKQKVPIRDYEGLKPYIEQIIEGEPDVLWPGKPIYFSKTSGTTSGIKYIPITKESIKHHIDAARNAILCYIHETKKTDFVDGKMIFLQGSPELTEKNGIKIGRLSGIVAHHVPAYLQKNRMPSYKTNCIEDWEQKVAAIVEETIHENMTLISGIPPWVQMYFDKLLEKSGKQHICEVFKNFSLFIYGGVNYEPYRKKMEATIGKKVDAIELYPASEGFIAYQNSQKDNGLLLNLDAGIFYEFIPAEEFYNENPSRISLEDVVLNKNYVIILNTNAGLWGYNIGDTVKFTSLNPYKIVVTGRIKHFISAFGEHVIGEEVDACIRAASEKFNLNITEYHVAPEVNPKNDELPYHEWFIAFAENQENVKMEAVANFMDTLLQNKNTYYKDLREGKMLGQLKIRPLPNNAFILYMKSIGKLGGQNKVPRLANDRKIADKLSEFLNN
jgi:phenylacetate-coenzyme A ligase PaaK-like adenylate-forming protein